MGQSWKAYSWLFEVILYGLFVRFGLLGILIYTYALLLAITFALHSLIRQFEKRLAQSVGLTAIAMVAMTRVCSPRPWLFTILFVCLELLILVKVRRSRNFKTLFWLLPIFVVWSNTHVQFVYGFFILGAAMIDEPLTRFLRNRFDSMDESESPINWKVAALALCGCMIAVLLNPFHFGIYVVVVDTFKLGGLYSLISELQSLPFRSVPDWLVLALVVGAAYFTALKRKLTPFWAIIFAGAAFTSFRGNRDVWFVVIVSAVMIARSQSQVLAVQVRLSRVNIAVVGLAVVVVLLGIARIYSISNEELASIIQKSYPDRAAAFIQQNKLSGRLYNHANWGGYLIWRLPELPVSIDGRSNLHVPDRLKASYDVWRGKPGWSSNGELRSSSIVVADKDFPLTQLLRLSPEWQLLYEDDVAVVFAAKR